MEITAVFLERAWIAVSPQGEEQPLAIRVTFPMVQPTGEWTSRVSLGNIKHGTDDIHGMDSWQAMELAMHHAAIRVRHLESQGWTFFWDDDDREPAAHRELFRGCL